MSQESLNVNGEGKVGGVFEMKSSPEIDKSILNKINSFDTAKVINLFSEKYPEKAEKIKEGLQATNNIINLATYFSFNDKNLPGRA